MALCVSSSILELSIDTQRLDVCVITCGYPPFSCLHVIIMNEQLEENKEADDKLRKFTKNPEIRFKEQAKTNDLLIVEVERLTAKIESQEVQLEELRNEVLQNRARLVELGDPTAISEAKLAASAAKDAEFKVGYRRCSTRCLLPLLSHRAACRTASSSSRCHVLFVATRVF